MAIYANNEHAINTLGWSIQYSLKDMLSTAWKWEKKIKQDETLRPS